MSDVIGLMKTMWNKRAENDAFYYIETNVDKKRFFEIGEERAAILIDPVLSKYQIEKSDKVSIDIGCGLGRFTQVLGRRFSKAIGVDVSDSMIAQAKATMSDVPNLEFVVSDGVSFPKPDHSVDFVWSYEVFQHMPSNDVIKSNVRETARILRPGGYGLLHFKSAYENPSLLGRTSRVFPNSWVQGIKRLLGKSSLTDDQAWRGARPLNKRAIRAMCEDAGLKVAEFRDDPTHKAGSRTFAVVMLAA